MDITTNLLGTSTNPLEIDVKSTPRANTSIQSLGRSPYLNSSLKSPGVHDSIRKLHSRLSTPSKHPRLLPSKILSQVKSPTTVISNGGVRPRRRNGAGQPVASDSDSCNPTTHTLQVRSSKIFIYLFSHLSDLLIDIAQGCLPKGGKYAYNAFLLQIADFYVQDTHPPVPTAESKQVSHLTM